MSAPPVLHAYARACIRALASAGVRHAVLCPGSRSTPLAVLLDREPQIRVWIHLDERAAAYFGLGIAKARQEPVALLCTSGTAAANFLPAVVEARYGRVPLVVLTADRPPELRDTGAPQAIDQLRLYGTHVKWFCDMPLPEPVPQVIGYAAAAVTRAVATAAAPPAGPVHLNFPFREPLWPEPAAQGAPTDEGEPAVGTLGEPVYGAGATARQIAALAARLRGVARGLLICGPQSDPGVAEAAADLAARLGWPILADPLSQVRCGVHDRSAVIDAYDAFLRDPEVAAALAPRLVVRLGGVPTSKTLLSWLSSHPGLEQVVIDTAAAWDDPA
ncbi:MAG TPA: 2-succinyl-5-enolpyruvyl-6-hydroxy-3-cyclohexene-1-carboxylic-acid synthase, partial [Limnochordia bacterium]